MKSGTCPKCNSTNVLKKAKGVSFRSYPIRVNTGGMMIGGSEFDSYVCADCGYFENRIFNYRTVWASNLHSQGFGCMLVKSLTLKRLPLLSANDFLFGSTSYGEWYIEDLQETKYIIQEVLKMDNDHSQYYCQSGW